MSLPASAPPSQRRRRPAATTARRRRRRRRRQPPAPTSTTSTTTATSTAAAALHLTGRRAAAPEVVRTIREWRQLEAKGLLRPGTLGLVPTMGALHEGHLSLARRAARENEASAATIFVNPAQFAAHEDLGTYPRQLERDLGLLAATGVDYVFAPAAEEMYPPDSPARLRPFVDLADIDTTTAEGSGRPGFFRGVATVVAKLFNITKPRAAYFGQKDGMQCVAVRRLIDDLNYDIELVVCPTVREADGLAMSSRNAYLSPPERDAAPAVFQSLSALAALHASGERAPTVLKAAAERVIEMHPYEGMRLEYLNLASALDGRELGATTLPGSEPILASIAVRVGTTRLIDNVLLGE